MESAPLDRSVTAVPIQIDHDAEVALPADLAVGSIDAGSDMPPTTAVVGTGSAEPTAPEPIPAEGPPTEPAGWSDPITGTDGPRFWDRIIASESARARRYHRPVTVGLLEIVGLERLATRWGAQVAERILVAVGRTIAREVRSSDHVARIDDARFGVLLTETDEVAAINCIERIRSACEFELGPAQGDVVIGFGWASPPGQGDLVQAVATASRRLAAELRQAQA